MIDLSLFEINLSHNNIASHNQHSECVQIGNVSVSGVCGMCAV